ncbi:MAG: hypothetical protein LBC53_02950 [Spirochaetaceae bacterium]|jgi:hypothetical protein|nr:hypothetical protein [Spirochaetaceae bacterium]
MEKIAVKDEEAYQKVVNVFKKQETGLTTADVVARTALSVDKVKELLPVAADEFSARLRVTESGEILYTFPKHLKSKYKGPGVFLRRAFRAVRKGVKTVSAILFKGWIMVMLVGYFVLFMLIALAAMLLSVAASAANNNSERRDSGGGFYLLSGIFNLIIRIWFYSELTKAVTGDYGAPRQKRPKGKPLYKAIFSFVFGDGDPNADIETREKKAFIAYVQANNGLISLPEFMTITGLPPVEAEERIVSYCAQFAGYPEASEDGVVMYRFNQLLLNAAKTGTVYNEFSAPIKRLKTFSSNQKKLNFWFSLLNGVNLIFGGYFFYNAMHTGQILTQAQFNEASQLYGITYLIFYQMLGIGDPVPLLLYGLGLVPLVFSAFFWGTPAIRSLLVKKENQKIKMDNLRKFGYKAVLDSPLCVTPSAIKPTAPECTPDSPQTAASQIIKEIGAYSQPEVQISENGETVYVFNDLERELKSMDKARKSSRGESLGGVVFDSGEEV